MVNDITDKFNICVIYRQLVSSYCAEGSIGYIVRPVIQEVKCERLGQTYGVSTKLGRRTGAAKYPQGRQSRRMSFLHTGYVVCGTHLICRRIEVGVNHGWVHFPRLGVALLA